MKSMNAFNTLVRTGTVLVFGLLMATGCANQDKETAAAPLNPDDAGPTSSFFPSDSGTHRITAFISTEVANGAREDGQVLPIHFNGTKLNSLGTEKLTRMVPEAGDDLTVYLNIPADELQTARHDAVAAYLATCGVETAHLKIENGPNPHSIGDAADAIANYHKTENSDDAGGASSGGGASSAGAVPSTH